MNKSECKIFYWVSGAMSARPEKDVTVSWCSTKTGWGLVGRHVNVGAGASLGILPFNGSAGVSSTFLLYRWK